LSPVIFTKKQADGCMSNLFCLSWRYYGTRKLRVLFFCPWCGKEYDYAFHWDLRGFLFTNGVGDAYLDDFDFNCSKVPKELNSRELWDNKISIMHKLHEDGVCKKLGDCLDIEDSHDIPLLYLSNIRTYAILNKRRKNNFSFINYCPFCGAKFPDRLDEKLTEILQKEYGLSSWEDYKRAPHEFHTDEWWKKRGL
jgi:hypothetical protein